MVRAFTGIPGTHLLEAITRTNDSFGMEEKKEVVAETRPVPVPSVKTQPAALMSILPGGKMPG